MEKEDFKGSINNEDTITVNSNNIPSSNLLGLSNDIPKQFEFKNSFDTTTAIAGLYLWLLFGFFTSLLSCDIQRVMTNNIYIKHIMALVTFFFLMSVVDKDNNIDVGQTWLKTFLVYILFMLSIKNKILVSATIIVLLLVDQTIKVHMDYKQRNNDMRNMQQLQKIRSILFYILIIIILLGYISYYFRQKNEFKDKFSHFKLFFGTTECRN